MKFLEYFLYLIIFLIPAYLARFSVFGIPTNVLEILIGAVFLVWAATKCKNKNAKIKMTIQRRFTIASNAMTKFLVAGISFLLFGFIAGVFISPDTMKSLGAVKSLFIAPFLFFIVARDVLDSREKKEKALWWLAFSGIGVGIIGLIYWLFGRITFDGRLAAFYESPNMLAMYVTPSLLIVAMRLHSKFKSASPFLRNEQNFTFYIVILIFDFYILILSRSLGAIIGILAAFLLYYFYTAFYNGRCKMRYRSFLVIIAIGIAVPFFSFLVNPWGLGRNSIASRAMVWRASADILKDNWLFGIGPGMFQEHYLAQQKNYPPYLEWAVPHPHNIFLTVWLYAGLPGLVGFFLILLYFLKKISTIPYSLFPIPFILLYLLFHGVVDNTLFRQDMAMIWGLLLAVM